MSTAEESKAPVNLKLFRDLMVKHFSMENVKDICFELQYDYENVTTENKGKLIRELIMQMVRENRLEELIHIVQRDRDNVSFSAIYDPLQAVNAWGSRENLIGTQRQPSDREDAQTAEEGLQTIAILANNQATILELIVQLRTHFEATSNHIDQITLFKSVHDHFQELEKSYFIIYNDLKRLPNDDTAWDNIHLLYEVELRQQLDNLIETIRESEFLTAQMRWAPRLGAAKDGVQTAVLTFNDTLLRQSIQTLNRLISRELTRTNLRLVNTAALLQLDPLRTAMHTISNQVPASEAAKLQQGATALDNIQSRMNLLVDEHNAWQEIDDEMRLIDGGFTITFDNLKLTWPNLAFLTQKICEGRTETWAQTIIQRIEQLTVAINSGLITESVRHFTRYRSLINHRFREADLQLFALCTELQTIGQSLHFLLDSLSR